MNREQVTMLKGVHWYVWYTNESGGVQGVIETCKKTHAAGVLIKAADGTDRWAQLKQDSKAIHDAGLILGAWSFDYAWEDANAEAQAICAALPDADYLVLDTESTYQTAQGSARAKALCTAVRHYAPDVLLGFSTFGAPNDHPQFPYHSFSTYCDFIQPQVYFADFGVPPKQALLQALLPLYRYHRPVLPVGQAYPPATAAEINEFSGACVAHNVPTWFWWDMQSSTPELTQAVADGAALPPSEPKHPKNPVFCTFDEAIDYALHGKEIQRVGWGSKWVKGKIENGVLSLDLVIEDNIVLPLQLDGSDITAKDWRARL